MPEEVEAGLDAVIRSALADAVIPPQQRQSPPQPRWTLKRLAGWVKENFHLSCCRETIREVLKRLGFSWKKARKLLNKANPEKRAAYLETLEEVLRAANYQQCLLVYMDEAHIHLDADEGYGWSIRGKRFWLSSCSPGRAKVSFYGLYLYNLGQVRIWPYASANGINTVEVLKRLRVEFPNRPIKLIWDGAPYHRSALVRQAAQVLEIELIPLPSYSPDFMPVEHLWQWLREEVTYHVCYPKKSALKAQVLNFEQRINSDPLAIADRLWVTTHLDPDLAKLRVST